MDFIVRGVRDMVPAHRRFWIDSTPMETLSSRQVGDSMNMVMQSIGLHQRLQEASREYTELEKTQQGLERTLREEEEARRRVMRELKTLKEAHQTLQQEYQALGDKQQAHQEDHRILGEKHKTLREEHQVLRGEHKTLQEEHKKQRLDHDKALEGVVEDWQRTEDFARAASEYSFTRMPGLIRWWLGHSDRSGEGMVEAMLRWQSVQEYHDYTGPPLVQVLQEWATTPGGRAAMGPVAEVWLSETLEGQTRLVQECKTTFYMGQRDVQDKLYGKLERRFTSFSIEGWKLPDVLPLRPTRAPATPSSTTPAGGDVLMTPEVAQHGVTSSVAAPSEPVAGSGIFGSVDPFNLHLTINSGSGFSSSAAASAAP
ncbi:PREDICTED: uncharacterized protein LOC109157428 [Ipomoea nil]|uniref:uncharacterized protein LOC109157428 n=1 Tax=Ipomoea nil TaxID=35883 RepID=UPI0009012C5C|nr:PREDICTED: uncharacterized protein LOC109157428 [Ipomoea nil]XP_019160881.1 PREDICTED: uncharacterized protein LOC109157428 [Ipomoea nil]